jgi:UDP-2,3-diacylglucosamine pyrophosphatase LpxH
MRKNILSTLMIITFIIEANISSANTEKVHFTATELLGRPTDHSITVNVVADTDLDIFFEYGIEQGVYICQTDTIMFPAGEPIEMIIEKLLPGTKYYYRMHYRELGESEFHYRMEHSFHSQRPKGSTFTFAIQTDSHLGTEKHCNSNLYKRTLQNILADKPDFLIDLGDTFRATKLPKVNYETVAQLYRNQRSYFGMVCHSVPLFFVIGNHEDETGWKLNSTPDNVAIWATKARKRYYLNPLPDDFYSGNTIEEEFVGLRENYFAWEWGDALFVALDYYWYTKNDPKDSGDTWEWTLGNDQYQWFKHILEQSDATFKFIFCHHLLGTCRGGAEWAQYFEWGGYNKKAEWEFNNKRPGWGKSIHQLMEENGVTIFFQGHDHIFVKQEVNGIIYQTCPMPADPTYTAYNDSSFLTGIKFPNSGHIRVTVSDSEVTVDYIRAFLPENENPEHTNGETACSYTIKADDTTSTSLELSSPSYKFHLEQNYPNPFNSLTHIIFQIPYKGHVTMKMYNVAGRLVKILCQRNFNTGVHTLTWNGVDDQGKRVPSGLYFYQLHTNAYRQIKKAILLK